MSDLKKPHVINACHVQQEGFKSFKIANITKFSARTVLDEVNYLVISINATYFLDKIVCKPQNFANIPRSYFFHISNVSDTKLTIDGLH